MKCLFGLVENCEVVNIVMGVEGEEEKKNSYSDEETIKKMAKVWFETAVTYLTPSLIGKLNAIKTMCEICPYRLEYLREQKFSEKFSGEMVVYPERGDDA